MAIKPLIYIYNIIRHYKLYGKFMHQNRKYKHLVLLVLAEYLCQELQVQFAVFPVILCCVYCRVQTPKIQFWLTYSVTGFKFSCNFISNISYYIKLKVKLVKVFQIIIALVRFFNKNYGCILWSKLKNTQVMRTV